MIDRSILLTRLNSIVIYSNYSMPNVVAHSTLCCWDRSVATGQPIKTLSTLAAYPFQHSDFAINDMTYNVYIKNYQNMCHLGALWKTNLNPLGFTAQVPNLQRWGCAGDLSWSGIWSLPCCPCPHGTLVIACVHLLNLGTALTVKLFF